MKSAGHSVAGFMLSIVDFWGSDLKYIGVYSKDVYSKKTVKQIVGHVSQDDMWKNNDSNNEKTLSVFKMYENADGNEELANLKYYQPTKILYLPL